MIGQQFRGYYSALLVREGDAVKIFEETVKCGSAAKMRSAGGHLFALRLLAHSCPGPVRRHVRSWRKPTPHSKAHPLVNRLNLA